MISLKFYGRLIFPDSIFLFLFVDNFKAAAIDKNCQAKEVIVTEDDCKAAAKEIGLTYVNKFNSDKHPLGCLYNKLDNAWFNENVNGPTNPAYYGMYGGVCHFPGKLYYTKI